MRYRVKIRLKDLLYERGLTQKQLAEMAGIQENTVSDITRGVKTSINIKHLEKIASVLEISDLREIIDLAKIDN